MNTPQCKCGGQKALVGGISLLPPRGSLRWDTGVGSGECLPAEPSPQHHLALVPSSRVAVYTTSAFLQG